MLRIRRICKEHTDLTGPQIDRLAQVSRNMQLLADLSYADIILYCRTKNAQTIVGAEAKPSTATSLYADERVESVLDESVNSAVAGVLEGGRSQELLTFELEGREVQVKAIPISLDGVVIAAMSRELALPEPDSEMELMYMSMADQMLLMLRDNQLVGMSAPSFSATRTAGDGIMKIDADGAVAYASPNAVSIYRRLGVTGNLVGRRIQEMSLYEGAVGTALEAKRAHQEETAEKGRAILKRAIPLLDGGRLLGALAIVRDVTDLRARDKELRIKDATIREIHHRVKNNLQTIASLLRLQARRLKTDEGRNALMESVSRISSIAVVHEILAGQEKESVDFASLVSKIADVVSQAMASRDSDIAIRIEGTSGIIPAVTATPLAMVVTELIQNAMEHAFSTGRKGTVTISLDRKGRRLDVEVADDGIGLPDGFSMSSSSNLGLQIVQTLVNDELHGELKISGNRGTRIRIALGIPEQEEELE